MMRDDLDIPLPVGSPSYRVARHPSSIDPATRRLLLIAGVVGATLLMLVGGYALVGHRSGGVPYVAAAAGPVRVKPDKPGGLEVVGADEQSPGQDGVEAMAAGAEAPDPKALRAQERAPVAPPVASPAPVSGPAAGAVASSAVPASAALVAGGPASGVAPSRAAFPPMGSPAGGGVTAAAPVGATSIAAAPVSRPAAASSGGAMQVQLAALGSEEAANAEWTRLSRRMPELLEGRRPAVTHIERDGKTYFRLRTGGFSDTAQAATFCQRVREKGGGCSIASF